MDPLGGVTILRKESTTTTSDRLLIQIFVPLFYDLNSRPSADNCHTGILGVIGKTIRSSN